MGRFLPIIIVLVIGYLLGVKFPQIAGKFGIA